MNRDVGQEKIRALPLQFIQVDGSVVLKRGCTEVRIGGENVAEAIKIILAATSNHGLSKQELYGLFDDEAKPSIVRLVDELLARRLLVQQTEDQSVGEEPESELDVFYWHFDQCSEQIKAQLNKRHIVILGVNHISRQLASAFRVSGIESFDVVDQPSLRNIRLFDDSGNLKRGAWPEFAPCPLEWRKDAISDDTACVIAASDFGRVPSISEHNKLCLEQNRHFLPVTLHNMTGYVGPLVVPGHTACFECLLARQSSHLEDPQLHRAIERVGFEGQHIMGFHPSMAAIIAEIAAFELMKFYSGVQGGPGIVVEVNLLATRLTSRKVLKIPRCTACSPLWTRPSITPKRTMFTLEKVWK
jgi:molybdopterin-synthase adenylyltransferase